ncbi:hypothetical protein [Streptomyces sp. CAU 1734]|uniref:hypothetical protein n=1 Tax=Streptomyces sp. CAU 1734 TaxID=3140360 RepID=UPI0032609E9A
MTDARSPLRTLRAALFAAICISLAAMGHSFTSGHDLPLTALLPALPVTAAAAWIAARRRRGAFSIGAALLAAQGALHLWFARVGTVHSAPPSPAGHPAPPPHGASGAGAAADTMIMADGTLLGPSPAAMIAVHLLSAAGCAIWLARGETAFLRLARAVGALAFTPLRPPPTAVPLPAGPRPVPHRHRTAPPRRAVPLTHTLIRRGPPVSAAPRATAPGAAV